MERASSVDGWEEFDRGRAIEHNRQEWRELHLWMGREEFDRGRAIEHNRQEWRELHLWMGRKSLIEEEPLNITDRSGESFVCGWVGRV